MLTRGKVVLFYPAYEGAPLSAPTCLLSLAATLREHDYSVVMIDAAIVPNSKDRVLRELDDALCLGISVLTGPMILGAIEVAKAAKELHAKLPIVFGGWHPTLLPEQTLIEPYVDFVVRRQGESSFLELVNAIASGQSGEFISGVSWKIRDHCEHNVDRPTQPLDALPLPAYDMVDFDAYERTAGERKLAYATSVGCPYACNYCTDMVFYKRRFNALNAERVVAEMTGLVAKFKIAEIALLDSNFPVDVKRAVAIARGIYESGVPFRWTFQASTDFLFRMSDDEVKVLRASGVSHMGFGTESTSESVLKLMNKRHQRMNEVYETARKADAAGIRVTFNLIFGYPGETENDRAETFRAMSEIAREFQSVSFSPNIFTPYPGIPIWPELREMGVQEPQSLREWALLPLGVNVLPWLQGRDLARLQRMLAYFLLNSHVRKNSRSISRASRVVRRAVSGSVRWRIRKSRFSFPWELWLARTTEHWAERRSLVTGQVLPKPSAAVCN
ncbi:Fe-S protein, radical SAM family [Candidatus Koribacter versatilis Ellin345]|uniref:Fe-S protein, radical SAM family n=1 Tax=Koribacter versatilis (strain Ellin345) TaxID=204669 RepID=Q1ITC3_KORVE|nr:radical SAM protein [Candidatus Koribacter versatilis]ABF39877.1 Fe-S protein, radical SAM family [Candidatus Koribacter versatilis Ellin345]